MCHRTRGDDATTNQKVHCILPLCYGWLKFAGVWAKPVMIVLKWTWMLVIVTPKRFVPTPTQVCLSVRAQGKDLGAVKTSRPYGSRTDSNGQVCIFEACNLPSKWHMRGRSDSSGIRPAAWCFEIGASAGVSHYLVWSIHVFNEQYWMCKTQWTCTSQLKIIMTECVRKPLVIWEN